MLKKKCYEDLESLFIDLRKINKRVSILNSMINIDLYNTEIDYLNKKIIIGDYFSLLDNANKSYKEENFYKKTLDYIRN